MQLHELCLDHIGRELLDNLRFHILNLHLNFHMVMVFVSYNKIKVIFNIRQNFCKFLFRKHVNLQNIIKMKMKKTDPQYVCTNTQYAVGQYEWHGLSNHCFAVGVH